MVGYGSLIDSPRAIEDFRRVYKIPDDVLVRQADPVDLVSRSYSQGWMPFPLISVIEGGVRFHFHPLLRNCLSVWSLVPCQLMPNVYKVIMGMAKLNEILDIDLGVHDIDDVYDIYKSQEGTYYYLRVKPRRDGFVHTLEDSNKYAGDGLLCFSGNWEFGADGNRAYRVPHRFEVVQTAQERKRFARQVGWVRNEAWHQAVKRYMGHEDRSPWKLLGYEPKYHGYYKRVEQLREGDPQIGELGVEVEDRTITVAEVGNLPWSVFVGVVSRSEPGVGTSSSLWRIVSAIFISLLLHSL